MFVLIKKDYGKKIGRTNRSPRITVYILRVFMNLFIDFEGFLYLELLRNTCVACFFLSVV